MGSAIREELIPLLMTMAMLMRPCLCQGECSPTFTLPNILKDQVSLQYNSGNQQTNSYLFFSGMFSGQPAVAYSISQLAVQQTANKLNFYLDVEVQDMYIYFYFNSPGVKWTVASVVFWITSRSDILVFKTVLGVQEKLVSGQNTTKSFDISSTASIDAKSTHIVFIVGIYSTYNQNLTLSANPAALTPTKGSVSVFVGSTVTMTNITVVSVIYNPSLGQFLSSSGTLSYKSFSSQFFNLFNNFIPIYYALTGVNTLVLTGANLNAFQFDLEIINSTILQGTSTSKFDLFGVSYMTIGVVTSEVCSPCNNYISSGTCVDSCPPSTYPFTFPDSGRACLTCESRVGQIMNSLGNGCNCLPGYELISAGQCVLSTAGSSGCSGVNVIQNGTTCICSPGTYNISGVCGACPAGQTYQAGTCIANSSCPPNSNLNSNTGKCVCDSGFMNISNVCVACQQGQYYDNVNSVCKCIGLNQEVNSQGACVCAAGFYSINGFCISCPSGTVFDGTSCVSSACANNQVMANGSCVCDSSSIPVGSLCIKCNSGTFVNKATNLCDSCIKNCVVCSNKITCSQCAEGYAFDFSSLSCYNPNAPAATKLVTLKTGFPFYTSEGIITDFIINSSISAKSKSDLMKMVSLSFADVNTMPLRIFYSQNGGQLSNIRVSFYYKGLIPLSNFTVAFNFTDSSINLSENITVPYQYSATNIQFKSF